MHACLQSAHDKTVQLIWRDLNYLYGDQHSNNLQLITKCESCFWFSEAKFTVKTKIQVTELGHSPDKGRPWLLKLGGWHYWQRRRGHLQDEGGCVSWWGSRTAQQSDLREQGTSSCLDLQHGPWEPSQRWPDNRNITFTFWQATSLQTDWQWWCTALEICTVGIR